MHSELLTTLSLTTSTLHFWWFILEKVRAPPLQQCDTQLQFSSESESSAVCTSSAMVTGNILASTISIISATEAHF